MLGQLDPRGRLLIYSALPSVGMGMQRFSQTILKPHLAEKFPGAPLLAVGDPSGNIRAQSDEKTVYEILKKEGFKSMPARTNGLVARLNAVDTYLGRQVDGGAGLLLDPEDCKPLIQALSSKYRYRLRKDGQLEDEPDKSHPWSDLADATQYLCMHADAEQGGRLQGVKKRPIKQVSAGGWT